MLQWPNLSISDAPIVVGEEPQVEEEKKEEEKE